MVLLQLLFEQNQIWYLSKKISTLYWLDENLVIFFKSNNFYTFINVYLLQNKFNSVLLNTLFFNY